MPSMPKRVDVDQLIKDYGMFTEGKVETEVKVEAKAKLQVEYVPPIQ